jgi:hypothetical protein
MSGGRGWGGQCPWFWCYEKAQSFGFTKQQQKQKQKQMGSDVELAQSSPTKIPIVITRSTNKEKNVKPTEQGFCATLHAILSRPCKIT